MDQFLNIFLKLLKKKKKSFAWILFKSILVSGTEIQYAFGRCFYPNITKF